MSWITQEQYDRVRAAVAAFTTSVLEGRSTTLDRAASAVTTDEFDGNTFDKLVADTVNTTEGHINATAASTPHTKLDTSKIKFIKRETVDKYLKGTFSITGTPISCAQPDPDQSFVITVGKGKSAGRVTVRGKANYIVNGRGITISNGVFQMPINSYGLLYVVADGATGYKYEFDEKPTAVNRGTTRVLVGAIRSDGSDDDVCDFPANMQMHYTQILDAVFGRNGNVFFSDEYPFNYNGQLVTGVENE